MKIAHIIMVMLAITSTLPMYPMLMGRERDNFIRRVNKQYQQTVTNFFAAVDNNDLETAQAYINEAEKKGLGRQYLLKLQNQLDIAQAILGARGGASMAFTALPSSESSVGLPSAGQLPPTGSSFTLGKQLEEIQQKLNEVQQENTLLIQQNRQKDEQLSTLKDDLANAQANLTNAQNIDKITVDLNRQLQQALDRNMALENEKQKLQNEKQQIQSQLSSAIMSQADAQAACKLREVTLQKQLDDAISANTKLLRESRTQEQAFAKLRNSLNGIARALKEGDDSIERKLGHTVQFFVDHPEGTAAQADAYIAEKECFEHNPHATVDEIKECVEDKLSE